MGRIVASKLEKNARTTESGLVYLEVVAGKGKQPNHASVVRVNYVASLENGNTFDYCLPTDKPVNIPLETMIPGLREGLRK